MLADLKLSINTRHLQDRAYDRIKCLLARQFFICGTFGSSEPVFLDFLLLFSSADLMYPVYFLCSWIWPFWLLINLTYKRNCDCVSGNVICDTLISLYRTSTELVSSLKFWLLKKIEVPWLKFYCISSHNSSLE